MTKAVNNNDALAARIVAIDMKMFWIVYESSGIWRGDSLVRLTSGLFIGDLPITGNEGDAFGDGGREGEGRMNVDERRAPFISILESG